MKTGFVELDEIIKLNKSKLIILSSRPGMGQTSLAFNIATNMFMKQDIAVLFFSVFESVGEINARILSSEAMVDFYKIRKGELEEDDWVKLAKEVEPFSKAKKDIYIMGWEDTLNDIKEKCIQMKKEKDIKFVVFDNLDDFIEITDERKQDIIEQLRNIVNELEITILLNMPLTRCLEKREDKKPKLEDIKDKNILELADIIMFLYRDDYYNSNCEKKNIAEVIVAKNNSGICETVELLWLKSYKKFANLARNLTTK